MYLVCLRGYVMEKVKNRIDWADISKGIGILLVVFAHLQIPGVVLKFVFSFHMPLFVLISGYFFRPEKLSANIKKLLCCYFSLGLITSLIYMLYNKYSILWFFKNLVRMLLGGSATHYRIDAAPALWFITALIVIELIAYLTDKIPYSLIPVSVICIAAAMILIRFDFSDYIPFNIVPALFLFPFYSAGILLKKNKVSDVFNKIQNSGFIIKFVICIILAAATFIISHYNNLVNIFRCDYGNSIILYYLAGFAGSFMIIIFSMILSKLKTINLLKWFGKNTVVIMGIHQLLILVADAYFSTFSGYKHYIAIIAEFFLIMLLSSLITVIINKFAPFLLGKQIKS